MIGASTRPQHSLLSLLSTAQISYTFESKCVTWTWGELKMAKEWGISDLNLLFVYEILKKYIIKRLN